MLLSLLAQDDELAFNTLFERYWMLLYNTAYKLLQDDVDSREIVNDVLLDVWQRRQTIKVDHVPAYLKTAVRYKVISHIRGRKVPAFTDLFDTIVSSPYHADNPLLERDLLHLVEKFIDTLPEKRKRIFILHFLEGLDAGKVAKELDLTSKTVYNQTNITLANLRSRLANLLHFLFHLPVFLVFMIL